MRNINKAQLLLVIAGVFIVAGIYFAPREEESDATTSNADEVDSEIQSDNPNEKDQDFDIELNKQQHEHIEKLEREAVQIADLQAKLSLYDSLIEFSKKNKIPPLVAKYTEEKAKLVETPLNWILTGDNYFKAYRLSQNQSEPMISRAIQAYNRALELDAENLDAQTALGVAYVEGAATLGEMPMKGIGILKEVLNKDPKNINALINLGYFAIQSGQLEKAVERFKQVIDIDPTNAEAYLYLTDVYLSQDDKESGLRTLEKYKSLVDDPTIKQQVDQYIKDLKDK